MKQYYIYGLIVAVLIVAVFLYLHSKSKPTVNLSTFTNTGTTAIDPTTGAITPVVTKTLTPPPAPPKNLNTISLLSSGVHAVIAGPVIGVHGAISAAIPIIPKPVYTPDFDDVAFACRVLEYSLPTDNADILAGNIDSRANKCIISVPIQSTHSPILWTLIQQGKVGAGSSSFVHYLSNAVGSPKWNQTETNTNRTVVAVSASANKSDATYQSDLLTLFQDLVNEFTPQIKNNLPRVNTILDVQDIVTKLNALYANISLLGGGNAKIKFSDAANQLVGLDRRIRQLIVWQQVLQMDTNIKGGYAGDSNGRYGIRAQILEDIGITQTPFNSLDTYGFDNPVNPFVYFNDERAINMLNATAPVLAPSLQAIAAANAAYDASQAATNVQTATSVLKVALSILL